MNVDIRICMYIWIFRWYIHMQLCIHQEILNSVAPANEISYISQNGRWVYYIFNAIYMHIFLPLFPLVVLSLVPSPLWWVSIWIKVIKSTWKKECFLWKEVEVLSVKKLLFLTILRHLERVLQRAWRTMPALCPLCTENITPCLSTLIFPYRSLCND